MQDLKTHMKHKKGQLGNLQGIVMTLVVIGILAGIGFLVLEEFRDQVESTASEGKNSTSYSGVNETINAMSEIPTWLTIIVILAIVGILLAIVFAVLPRAR